jgi:uroporphyrinogen-III decarboxylase
MATRIYPKEDLFMEILVHPEKIVPLLRICTDTIKIYAKAFAEIGAGVVVFDSFVSPPLLSPAAYRELILPFHREIFHFLQELGVLQRTLIIGGNTLPILPEIIASGATQFLLDFTIPLEAVREVLQEYSDLVFRVNLAPALFSLADQTRLKGIIHQTLESLRDHPNMIIGTGILPPDVPPATILSAKNQIVEFYK